jgi:type IV pilus assembly protein PilV
MRPLVLPPSTRSRRGAPRRGQSGSSLIEVLVSLLIFSLGVLGMVAMQAKAISYSVDAEDRSRAAILANEIVAAMWAEGRADPSISTAWQTRVASAADSGLANGAGTIVTTTDSATGIKTTLVTITWRAPSKASSEPNTYFTQVVIP